MTPSFLLPAKTIYYQRMVDYKITLPLTSLPQINNSSGIFFILFDIILVIQNMDE